MGQCFRSYVLRWSQRIRDDTVQQMLQSYEYCQLVASMLMLFMMVLCSVLFYDRCALCFICLSSLARSTFVRFLLHKNDIHHVPAYDLQIIGLCGFRFLLKKYFHHRSLWYKCHGYRNSVSERVFFCVVGASIMNTAKITTSRHSPRRP
jgi:tRNA(His) 5'-end guanylyltransferase